MKALPRLLFPPLAAAILACAPLFSTEQRSPQDELASIIGAVRTKTAENKTTPEDLAPEIKRFDDLVASIGKNDPNLLAQVLQSQATFYLRVARNPSKAMQIAERLKKDLPSTGPGRQADSLMTSIRQAPPPPPPPAPKSPIEVQTEAIRAKLLAKVAAGKSTEADFAPELAEFDALYNKHKAEKTDPVAAILLQKASFYAQVLRDPDKALAAANELKTEFPNTNAGRQATALANNIQAQAASMRIQQSLTVGSVFPDFSETDTTGAPLSIARFKGKVVLVDFWAMWCNPCIDELPNVVKAYEKHHASGFEIVGISLDREGDGPRLGIFTRENKMPWPQYFDGKFWNTKLAEKYGVMSIPATFLLDGDGRIIAKNLRGAALDAAIANALGK